ncbi:MAG: uroporphyrinogen decarboxylase family protein [Planctomycetota bacterium]|jgi:uroporphyrinogen decarboxylase
MSSLTGFERVSNIFNRKSVDQIPAFESIWGETAAKWKEEGRGEIDEIKDKLEVDFESIWALDKTADIDFEPVVVEETEETIVTLDGNGATLRKHKLKSTTPEHVDFKVKDRAAWEELIKPHLIKQDRRRINFESYKAKRAEAKSKNRFFTIGGVGPFECMHPVCGHEYMLMGMALDPDWVKDMVNTYVDFIIRHYEILFTEEGLPDGAFVYEDMGFKEKPFFSPEMYRDIIQPGHKKLFDYFHSKGFKVMVHSCGYVEDLVPGLIEAGMDCLQAMEVKAGMDMPRLFGKYGDKISFCGNIDVPTLITNDFEKIEAELRKKILPVLEGGGYYMLHSDHSIPPEINYETVEFFFAKARELSREVFAARV